MKETSMQNCSPSQVPMDYGVKYSKTENEVELDETEYRKVVSCLRYLLHTRPDMVYSVGIVSRYMKSPRESQGYPIRNLMRYLKKTTSYGIKYGKNGSRKIFGYSDSSHSIDEDDGRSTTGHAFYYWQSPIT
ncbi:secreted RxLR effector protein 161-like [Bidens hawaiensis]|uniref:secreted RxLR effector protein 161-like n=1 Tax=Bidens hawaiensis TaxID=980011 RepID=UPI00404AE7C5